MILNHYETTKLALLKQLINTDAPLAKQTLMTQLNISLSTLNRNIQHVNEDIHLVPEFQSIQILSRGNGYSFINPSPFNPHYVSQRILLNYYKESLQFNLIKLIFSYSVKHISELATIFSISEPYAYKLLAKTNQYIAPFQLRIEFSKTEDHLRLSGNNQTLRLFKMYFFWSVNHGIEWPFSELSIDQLYSFFSESELDLFFKISQNKQQKFLYSLAVANQVFPNKHSRLVLSEDFLNIIEIYQQAFDLSAPLERLLLFSYGPEIDRQALAIEKSFFNFSARVFCPCTDTIELQNKIGEQLCALDSPLISYCKQLIKLFYDTFLPISPDDDNKQIAYQMLYYWSLLFLNVFYIRFDSSNLHQFMFLNVDTESKKTAEFKKAKEFFDAFIKRYPPIVSVTLSDFHLELCYGLIYYFFSNTKREPLTLYIQFSKSMFGETYIKARLLQMFGKENIVFSDNIHTASLIISNYFEDRFKNNKYFFFDDLENSDMWNRLYSKIYQLQID